jgi:hypothetical protein
MDNESYLVSRLVEPVSEKTWLLLLIPYTIAFEFDPVLAIVSELESELEAGFVLAKGSYLFEIFACPKTRNLPASETDLHVE